MSKKSAYYDDVASLQPLTSSWHYLRNKSSGQKKNTTGIDRKSVYTYSLEVEKNIRLLSRNMKISSPYEFSLLKPFFIPKSDGNERVICVPTVDDRIVQRSILNFLSDGDKCKLNNNVSFGFIPGKRHPVKEAVTKAKNLRKKYQWVYKTDIKSFFDRIPREELKDTIDKKVRYPSLRPVLHNAVDCEIYISSANIKKRVKHQGIKNGRGIRQGMSLSPFFSNLVLIDFDRLLEKNHLNAIRYADDLIFFCSNEKDCINVHDFCKSSLCEYGLDIPDIGAKKTSIYNPSETAEFLGMGIVNQGTGYAVEITGKQIKKIKADFNQDSSIKELVKQNITISKLTQRLRSRISGYLNAYEYADNIKSFEIALNSFKSTIVKDIFIDQLGLNLSALSSEELRFLELDMTN